MHAIAPRRGWAAGSASGTLVARLQRFGVRSSTCRQRQRRRVHSAESRAVDGRARRPWLRCSASDGVPTATLDATCTPSHPDVAGLQGARRARSRHACHALECVTQRTGNGGGSGYTRLRVEQSTVTGDGRGCDAMPAMACQLRRWLQRARHRTQTWLGCRERVEHALGTPATLWSALLNVQATAEAAGALG